MARRPLLETSPTVRGGCLSKWFIRTMVAHVSLNLRLRISEAVHYCYHAWKTSLQQDDIVEYETEVNKRSGKTPVSTVKRA
jgi:hypothetical protein